MTSKPWMKFYPQDWRGEPKLRACSIAARGLWIEMIALAHDATPYGHVLINGNAPDTQTLSRMVGVTESECESLVSELARNGVFSQTRKGIIYSRRMVRDAKKSANSQKNGKLGGNPKLSKQRIISRQDKPPDKGHVKAQIPDTRSQIPDNKKPTSSGDRQADPPTLDMPPIPDRFLRTKPDLLAEHFGLLWERYRSEVRRVGALGSKADAEAAFRRHIRDGATVEEFGTALDRYVASLESEGNVGTQFAMRAEKWFRKGWKDEHGEDDFKEWLAAQ